MKGSIYCITSDGESRCGKALIALTEHMPLSLTSSLFAPLSGLPLLNLMVGEDELTLDKDYKHIMKWLWHVHLRPNGISISGVQITSSILWSHLEANQYSINQINNLMNVMDKQDVTTMFNLMQLIWSLPPPLATDKPIFHKAHSALNQHSKLLWYLILPYINVDMNLHEQLKYLSTAAHLAYLFFTHHNAQSAFLPFPLLRYPDYGEKCLLLHGEDKMRWPWGWILLDLVGDWLIGMDLWPHQISEWEQHQC